MNSNKSNIKFIIIFIVKYLGIIILMSLINSILPFTNIHIIFLIMLIEVIVVFIFILHKTFKPTKWSEWYKIYKASGRQQANHILDINNISNKQIPFENIEDDVSSNNFISIILSILCALSIIIPTILTFENSLKHLNNSSLIKYSIASFLLIMVVNSVWATNIMYKSMKIVRAFYMLPLDISNTLEGSLEIIVPFYIADISLFLSAIFNLHNTTYLNISLIIISISIIPLILGINSQLRIYINNNLLQNRNLSNIKKLTQKESYLVNITQDLLFPNNKSVVEIPIKSNSHQKEPTHIIEVPLCKIKRY